ncbi:MAG: hypothetical protein NTV14_02055 [Coprothermobacterota bacterium]|nr:hypothetical protein [Coprothermobacterota bacterium]
MTDSLDPSGNAPPSPPLPPGRRPTSFRSRLLWVLIPVLAVVFLTLVIFRLPLLFPVAPAFPPLSSFPLVQPANENLSPGRLPMEFSDTATSPADIPLQLMIYRTGGAVDLPFVEDLCQRLSVFPSIRMTPQAFLAGRDEELLVWRNSGSFMLSLPRQSGPLRMLSGEQAIERARAFLEEKSLWPKEAMASRITLLDPSREQVTVQFCRWLEGVLVADSSLEVSFLGEQVASVYSNCRPLQALQDYPLLTFEQAKERLLAQGLGDFQVQGVRLVYQEAAPKEEQRYLLPVFAFWGKRSDSGQPFLYKAWALDIVYLSP